MLFGHSSITASMKKQTHTRKKRENGTKLKITEQLATLDEGAVAAGLQICNDPKRNSKEREMFNLKERDRERKKRER